ncbi:MAG: 50S ribosomal protein L28 [Holosporales bacterium]|jgi:large subunit ribosomal protein L28|nr:50S ribosomal protein L28 [Holosporales bacterium]
MSRRCEITGKFVLYGNNVSHANNKSSRRFLPNLQNISFMSEVLNMAVRLRVTPSAVRSVEANGGIDEFLLKTDPSKLGKKAAALKKIIAKRRAEVQI